MVFRTHLAWDQINDLCTTSFSLSVRHPADIRSKLTQRCRSNIIVWLVLSNLRLCQEILQCYQGCGQNAEFTYISRLPVCLQFTYFNCIPLYIQIRLKCNIRGFLIKLRIIQPMICSLTPITLSALEERTIVNHSVIHRHSMQNNLGRNKLCASMKVWTF